MRQIKFRARAIVNDKHNGIKVGDFVFGHYIESGADAPCIIFGDGEQIEIDKETLGQLIGPKDFDGIEVYDSDILKAFHFHLENGRAEYLYHIVKWSEKLNGWFMLNAESMDENDGSLQAWVYFKNHYDATVIGNIHQSPELLEK